MDINTGRHSYHSAEQTITQTASKERTSIPQKVDSSQTLNQARFDGPDYFLSLTPNLDRIQLCTQLYSIHGSGWRRCGSGWRRVPLYNQ